MATKKKASKKKASKKVATKKAVAKTKPTAISKALSKDVADFIMQKTNISAASKQLDEMKSVAAKLEAKLMIELEEAGQTGVSVPTGSIKFAEKDVFNAKDWKKIYANIIKTKNFGLLQKRLSSGLLKEMFNDTGKTIPGVEHFVKKSLSHTKAKK